jgi:hypothetical protein
MKISDHFALGKSQYELDFVDIDPDKDTALFVDPYFLAQRTDSLSVSATRTLRSFFDTFLNLVRQNLREEAREHFSYLGEPNETCLGLSHGQPHGRGIGRVQADRLFSSLVNSKAVQTGLVEHIEDCRLFIRGFDKDMLSDLTTNVIRGHLIEYTQAQCKIWGIPLEKNVPSGWVWRRDRSIWDSFHTEMLVIDSRPILLVPKGLVSYSTSYTADRYHRHFILNYLRNEHLRINSALVQRTKRKDGTERVWINKKDIEKEEAPKDKEFLTVFTQKHSDVFRKFKEESSQGLSSLDNSDLTDRKLHEIVSFILDELKNIPPGPENAGSYHRLIVGILELIFYPTLTYPQVEQEINDGRKRIDIVFDNAAKVGFFSRLQHAHRIPCAYIFIECKNYTRDVANPELDQMIARFSPNRGKFGLVVCRNIENMDLLLARCRDAHMAQQGTILPLVDGDLITMLEALVGDHIEAVDELLSNRIRSVVLG